MKNINVSEHISTWGFWFWCFTLGYNIHDCIIDLPLSYTCYGKGIIILLSRPLKFSESEKFFIVLSRFWISQCSFKMYFPYFLAFEILRKWNILHCFKQMFEFHMLFCLLILCGKFKRLKSCFTLKSLKDLSAFIWHEKWWDPGGHKWN